MTSASESGILPRQAIHPGRYVVDELDDRGWSSEDLASRIGRSSKSVERVLRGRAPITKPLADDLESELGLPAAVMRRLQESYEETLSRLLAEPEMRADIELVKERNIPWREFVKRGWMRNLGTEVERVGELRVLYDVETLSEVETGRHEAAFRITQKTKFDPWALAAWLQQGEWQVIERRWDTQTKQSSTFDPMLFGQNLGRIRELTSEPGFWKQMQLLCAAAGVHLELVPHVPKSGANGVTRWMEDGRPLIQLSLFRGWADVFWFTFFHEAAHALREHRRNIYINLDRVPREDDAEREADDFARDFLISPKDWEPFWHHKTCSRVNINRLADDVGVHPGIVVGRLQHDRLIPYSAHNDLRTKLEYSTFAADSS